MFKRIFTAAKLLFNRRKPRAPQTVKLVLEDQKQTVKLVLEDQKLEHKHAPPSMIQRFIPTTRSPNGGHRRKRAMAEAHRENYR